MSESPESLDSGELLKGIRGICVVTKTMASSCPLAEIISNSGIESVLPQISIQINSSLGQDYQYVIQGGDYKGLDVLDYYVPRGSFGVATSSPPNTVYFGVDTMMMDNSSWMIPLLIGLKGVSIKDRNLLWEVTLKLFPNVEFKMSPKKLSFDEQYRLGKLKIIPLPQFDLSENLPGITNESFATAYTLPTAILDNIQLDQQQKERVKDCLMRYKRTSFGSKQVAILMELAKIIPGFRGLQIDNTIIVINEQEDFRIWTLAEIKALLNTSPEV